MHTILIVDDDPLIHRLLGKALESESYQLISANSAEEAIEVLDKGNQRIAAVITDWNMPGMKGPELIRWMKERRELRFVPAILLSVNIDKEHIQEGLKAGAFYYLAKPFRRDLLATILKSAIREHDNIRELGKEITGEVNPYANLQEGEFRFKSMREAELIAKWIANASAIRQDALVINELLTNAIEHGNLGISYEDKSKLLASGDFLAEINRRQAEAKYSERSVYLKVTRKEDQLEVYIRDDGDGFDYKQYLEIDESRIFDSHGRGIAIANAYLEIEYLGKGNEVVVRLPLT